MFGIGTKKSSTSNPADHGLLERAKEATRRATFLVASTMQTQDEESRALLRKLFQVCRSTALSAGAAVGQSEAQVDEAISVWTEADVTYFKTASDEEIREFAAESGKIVKAFLEQDAKFTR